MPTKTSTTPKEELTFTLGQIEKASMKVKDSIVKEFSDSAFKDVTDLVCKLFIKHLKEELK